MPFPYTLSRQKKMMINNKISVIPRIYKTGEVKNVELKEVLKAIQTGIANEKDIRKAVQLG